MVIGLIHRFDLKTCLSIYVASGLLVISPMIGFANVLSQIVNEPLAPVVNNYSENDFKKIRIDIKWLGGQTVFAPAWHITTDATLSGGRVAAVSPNQMREILETLDQQTKTGRFYGWHSPKSSDGSGGMGLPVETKSISPGGLRTEKCEAFGWKMLFY